jgi:hypothetical protein
MNAHFENAAQIYGEDFHKLLYWHLAALITLYD